MTRDFVHSGVVLMPHGWRLEEASGFSFSMRRRWISEASTRAVSARMGTICTYVLPTYVLTSTYKVFRYGTISMAGRSLSPAKTTHKNNRTL